MGKNKKASIAAEIRSKRAFSAMRLKLGRYQLTREEVAQVRAELDKQSP
jgi:hypothetical protein